MRLLFGVAAAVGTLFAAYVLLRLAPNWLDQPGDISPTQEAVERGRLRAAGIAFLIAVLTAIGAVHTALTFRLSRRGQGTERFNKAIELLGHHETSVRIGGIHALGQLARDDPRAHHQGVLEVLLAYVRDRSPWPLDQPAWWRRLPLPAASSEGGRALRPPRCASDVQAAMAILARRKTAFDPDPLNIDLSNTNLSGIEAPRICLRGAVLAHTQLHDAELGGADLRDADLVMANLNHAGLEKAQLGEASLRGADLVGTRMRTANGLDHDGTKLDDATFSLLSTDWPDGFNPVQKGARAVPHT